MMNMFSILPKPTTFPAEANPKLIEIAGQFWINMAYPGREKLSNTTAELLSNPGTGKHPSLAQIGRTTDSELTPNARQVNYAATVD